MGVSLRPGHWGFIFVLAALVWAPRGIWGEQARFTVLILDGGLIALFALALAAGRQWSASQMLVLVTICYYLLRALDGNVPDAQAAYLGVRKTIFFLMALYVGLTLRSFNVVRIAPVVVLIGALMLVVAIRQFFFWSAFDDRLVETLAANIYTHQLHGMTRAIGLFSSPFTLGMLGAVVLAVIHVLDRKWLVLAAVMVGWGLIALSLTRVNIVAGLVVLAVGYLFARFDMLKAVKLSALMAACLGVAWYNIEAILEIVATNLDLRLISRLDSLENAMLAFGLEPDRVIYGFGTGSAGDGLSEVFAGHQHITSHNLFLKYLFEGGVTGLGLLSATGVSVILGVLRAPAQLRAVGIALLMVILVNGLTGGTVDAIPSALFAALMIGRVSAVVTASARTAAIAGGQRRVERPNNEALDSRTD